MKLNQTETNDISQFSTHEELCVALVGKYLKNKSRNYCLTLRGCMCFIHTWGDCEVQIPNHFTFKFTDDDGEHTINENTNKITIKGCSQIFFTINDK